MNAERWEQLERVFQAAVQRPPGERRAILMEACGGDESLMRQAERLVASFEEAADFIETPAFVSAIQLEKKQRTEKRTNAHSSMTACAEDWQAGLAVGLKIRQYELHSLLGRGGMGEVYLARDGRLDRHVALKLLPAHFTKDPEHVRRFEREARAASSLNHPNIITIHEIGQDCDTHFIATEFIEGQTLRQQINGAEIPLSQVIDIAVQIAGALSAAHSAGIVHRDIKPENIMVRPDGLVKVLDFGLAKPLEQASVSTCAYPPGSIGSETDGGTLMGTTSYLSPEQVRSEQVDHRTDIFNLGVVLYEMLSARRPFTGKSRAAIFDSILSESPPAIVERELPAELENIINHALEKDRAARYQTAHDLKADLKQLQRGMESNTGRSGWRAVMVKAAVILGVLLTLSGWRYMSLRHAVDTRGGGQALESNHGKHIKQTAGPGQELVPTLSPDGEMLAYASRAESNWDIYIQPIRDAESGIFPEPVNLTAGSVDDDVQPAFSPDGKEIAFRSSRDGGGIFVMDTDGARLKKISDTGFNPTWSYDGQEVIFGRANGQGVSSRTPAPSPLYAVNLKTGRRRVLTESDAVQPSCSPHGLRIAYWGMREGGQRDIWTVAASGGTPVPVTNDSHNDWNPVWSHDGTTLYFASDRDGKMNLWRISIDEQSGEPRGNPEPASLPGDYVKHFNLSKEGRLMAYVQESQRKTLYRIGFDPAKGRVVGRASAINPGSRLFSSPDVSPDGEWLVFTNQGEKQEDLFLMRTDGKGMTRLTNDVYKDRGPRWSRDGKRIAFYSDRSGKYEAWLINPENGELQQLTYDSESMIFYPLWSSDSRRILFRMGGVPSPFLLDLEKPWVEQSLVRLPLPSLDDTDLRFGVRDWSSDGRMLAGTVASRERPNAGLMLYSLETREFEQLAQSGDGPLWLNDNRRLLYFDANALWLIDTRTKKRREIFSFLPAGQDGYTISRDNRTIYFSLDSTESDIWLRTVE